MKTLGIIPARYASSRFPGKLLALLAGKSVLRRVYEQSVAAKKLSKVLVATDDERIFQHVRSFGGEVVMTSPGHQSGTDRCAEVAAGREEYDRIVNIQGDEPFIDPGQIDQLVFLLEEDGTQIATLAKRIYDQAALSDPSVVKVVMTRDGHAMYFSRSIIPHVRGITPETWLEAAEYYKHIGLYGFRRSTLLEIPRLSPGKYEKYESLEQLRWLEHGLRIRVGLTNRETIGVDTPDDLERAEKYLLHEKK